MMRRRVQAGGLAAAGPEHQPQHPRGGPVKYGLVQVPGRDRVDDRPIAHPELGRHLQIQASAQRRDPVVHGAPVGNDHAVEAPLLAQHVGEQPPVLRGVLAVDLVVGAHHQPRPGRGDDVLERREVDLPQGPLVGVRADPHPVGFLVVRGEVLHAAADLLRLQPVDHRRGEPAGQVRVFGEVLEVAPAQRVPLDVESRAEDRRDVLGPRLRAEGGAYLPGQVRVPGAAQRRGGREAGGGLAVPQPGIGAALGLLAQPVRAVRHHDRLDAEFADRRGMPEIGAEAQRRLLRHAQLGQQSHY
jgi:hypothetical protein